MKYSILIPVYNTQDYLEECVQSVLNQSIDDFEIIIANDGSTDNSASVCNRLASLDSRIHVYHKENERLMMTRRFEIAKAQGEYVLFLDSDDYWSKDLLETIDGIIDKYDPDMVIYSYYRLLGGRTVKNKAVFENETVFEGRKERLIYEGIGRNRLNSMWIKAVKRAVLLQDKTDYRQYQGEVVSGEDIFQSIPLFLLANKVVYIDKPLVYYRVLPGSITSTFTPKKLTMVQIEYNRKLQYLEQFGYDDRMLKQCVLETAYYKLIHIMYSNLIRTQKPCKETIDLLRQQRESEFGDFLTKSCSNRSVSGWEKLFSFLWKHRIYRGAYTVGRLHLWLRKLRNGET